MCIFTHLESITRVRLVIGGYPRQPDTRWTICRILGPPVIGRSASGAARHWGFAEASVDQWIKRGLGNHLLVLWKQTLSRALFSHRIHSLKEQLRWWFKSRYQLLVCRPSVTVSQNKAKAIFGSRKTPSVLQCSSNTVKRLGRRSYFPLNYDMSLRV